MRRSLFLAGLVLLPVPAVAQLAATVPSSDPVYAVVDEISATMPVRGVIDGQRPWSRREVARIVIAFEKEARARARDGASPIPGRVASLVDSLGAAYDDDIRELRGDASAPSVNGRALRGMSFGIAGANALPRAVPGTNGLGSVDAVTEPLVEPNWGRPVADGGTATVETIHEMGIGAHLAIAAQPRVSWLQGGGRGYEQADFQRLYARGTLANIGVEAGLDEILWGQAGDRGMLLSANPHPLHALTVANDTAITLPWILRHLGPTRMALMIADLGHDQYFPGSKLVNYKVSVTPTARLELGAGMMDEMGGSGSPTCSLGCRVLDLFPYITWIHPASDPLATNKVAVGELRYRIPEAAGLTLTYEGDMDDLDFRRIRSMLWDNTAHMFGARFDRLTADGRLALDFQVQRTPLTLYQHAQFRSGLTYHRAIVGDPLGVHGTAAYGTITWRQSLLTNIALSGAIESRDASTYTVHTTDANGDGWTFLELTDRPRERRARLVLSVDRQILGSGFGYSGRAGIERVANDDFAAGAGRTNGLAELIFRRYF